MFRLLLNSCMSMPITLVMFALVGCDLHEPEIRCEDQIKAYDKQDFVTDDLGMAMDPNTGTRWFRCTGGKRFVNYRCQGEALHLSWDEATAYAKEFSEKSGVKWRLPTNKEMKSIIQSDCVAPAINTNVFLDAEVANHWTSSSSLHQDTFRCSLNTYNGRVSCRQARIINQPFMLVRER